MNEKEKLLTLRDAAATLPRRVHMSTFRRWYACGIHGVRLETVLVGGRRFTSCEAIERFITATTSAATNKQKQPGCQPGLFEK